MAAKKQRSPVLTVVIMILIAGIIVGVYFMLNRSSDDGKNEVDAKETECQSILGRDMTNDYPGTVRELLKYYGRIQKCMINDTLTDEEFESLVQRLRELFDEQLLAANPYDFHLAALRAERKSYESSDSKINSCTVDSNDSIKKRTIDGRECSVLSLYFTVKTGTEFNRSYEDFLCRADEGGKWKILGWQQTENKKD